MCFFFNVVVVAVDDVGLVFVMRPVERENVKEKLFFT